MAKYYKIRKQVLTFQNVYYDYNKTLIKEMGEDCRVDWSATEEERGLEEACEEGGQHDWLVLPYEKGQKQYLRCLKCNQISHL